MRKLLVILLAALVIAGVGTALGLTLFSPDDPPEEKPAEPLSTPLAEVDTAALTVARAPFCDRVPAADVAAALGGEPSRATSYGNGDTARIAPGVRDVAHEYACGWTGAGGRSAAAWVFAPPVTPSSARTLAADAPRGCRPVEADEFGTPSSALLCGDEVTYRGLFGDAWLACSLTGPKGWANGAKQADAVDRTGRWCASVLSAAVAG